MTILGNAAYNAGHTLFRGVGAFVRSGDIFFPDSRVRTMGKKKELAIVQLSLPLSLCPILSQYEREMDRGRRGNPGRHRR